MENSISKEEFDYISSVIKEKSGIILSQDKMYLIESRFKPIMKERSIGSLSDLVSKMKTNTDSGFMQELVEAMTINESLFFRDIKPFKTLTDFIIPAIKEKNNSSNLNIWSAACSTGQEPYSIAMTLKDTPAVSDIVYNIDATDINQTVIDKAASGIYSQFEVQRGVPTMMLMKYFMQNPETEEWTVNQDVKSNIKFFPFNLVTDKTPTAKYDIVFCRNVLIYFDKETKENIIRNIHSGLKPYGFLVLGGAENILGMTDDLFDKFPEYNGVFRKK